MPLSSKNLLPKEFTYRLSDIYTKKECSNIYDAYSFQKPHTIRVNTLKSSALEVASFFTSQKIPYMIVSWFENAFILPHITFKQLSQMNIFPRGEIYVQNLSSMVPPILLNPKPGEKVLDICSAPGSKTTQMAAMMQNTGEVLAVDSSLRRLEVLKANLLIQGVTNTSVLHGNGQDIWKTYPNYFDKALVDVPCSMEGKFFILDPKTYSFWSLEKIHEYARISQWLLLSAVGAVRVGGEILYSTCTIAPEENESVIDWILKKTKHTVRIIDMEYSGIPYIPGLRSWREKQYMLGMEKTWRILPSKILEGFFIAKLKKLE